MCTPNHHTCKQGSGLIADHCSLANYASNLIGEAEKRYAGQTTKLIRRLEEISEECRSKGLPVDILPALISAYGNGLCWKQKVKLILAIAKHGYRYNELSFLSDLKRHIRKTSQLFAKVAEAHTIVFGKYIEVFED